MDATQPPQDGLNRRSFIKTSAGAATGAVVVAAPAVIVSQAMDKPGVVVKPSAPTPKEPVMAYIRDAKRSEVTVLSGTQETTYRDPALVKRLLDAVVPHDSIVIGGGADVLAP